MKSLDDYEVISVIGNGSFGTCFKVQDKITNKIYAWKAINYDEFEESKKDILDSEIGFLQQLKHPNIVQYFDHICNIETKTIFIIMEYCDGGDLQNLINKCKKEKLRFEEKYIWKVLYQISKALQLCHNKISEGCILHRDIKPANIFLDKCGNVKLGDFGLARIIKRNQQSFAASIVGSPYYMSPEIVRGRKYDKKSDMWAVGCLLYEMCCLVPPFRGNRFEQLSENISNGTFKSIPSYYSKDLQEIISFLLEVDSEQRPNVEILLRHPVFIRNLNDLKADFPKLLPQNTGMDNKDETNISSKKLLFSPVNLSDSSINFTFNNSKFDLNRSFDRLTDIKTNNQLRTELFDVPENKSLPRTSSFPDLNSTVIYNERIYANSIMTSKLNYNIRDQSRNNDPQLLTRDIFEEALRTRLEMLRAQEMLLKQRENNLMEREKQLMARELRLTLLEKNLEEKKHHVEGMLRRVAQEKRCSSKRYPKRRISTQLDESYCTIEPNECQMSPTVAKLEMFSIQPSSTTFNSNVRKHVSFCSPQKIFKTSNENLPPPSLKNYKPNIKLTDSSGIDNNHNNLVHNLQSSQSSKMSTDSENSSHKVPGKRRSILSIFGLNTNSQKSKSSINSKIGNKNVNNISCKDKNTVLNEKSKCTIEAHNIQVLDKVNSNDIKQIWTKENKKAAFEMLAAMKAADDSEYDLRKSCTQFVNSERSSNLRRTTRERATSLNRRSKLRRSAVYLSPNTSANRIIL